MELNDLLAQIEGLSDDDKRILIAELTRMLPAENGSSAPKVVAETALADAYVVDASSPTQVDDATEAYYARIRAEYEARQALLPVHPDKMLKRGMFKGRIPLDDEFFKLAEWHPSEE